jgi:hypothetical protein
MNRPKEELLKKKNNNLNQRQFAMKKIILFLVFLMEFYRVEATLRPDLQYFLPDIPYKEHIKTPGDFFGFEMGEWHVSHDGMIAYYRYLESQSSRIKIKEYARSYENRPLILVQISAEENISQLEEIREKHSRGIKNGQFTSDKIVLYQAYSVHGNEASASQAALLVAYYLAAGDSEEVEKLLSNMVILIDPCLNPDGYQRFSTWVNMHKNKNLSTDPNDREFSEYWPGGRTNHYWFDLNRDYLMAQHPESKGRLKVFHDWKPHVYTDFHEMSPNSTYFFMPGVPSRTFPLTLPTNQTLTDKISHYHVQALDQLGSLYYTREDFDDFYIGKGSTFPDINGCIGILFEQGSSRGHGQQTVNGLLSFAFAIRNQVATSLSSQKASYELRESLSAFQKEFYQSHRKKIGNSKGGYLLSLDQDPGKLQFLTQILDLHEIEYEFYPDNAKPYAQKMFLPFDQYQYYLLKGMFERQLTFTDSIFYDVSTWTVSDAFGYPLTVVDKFPIKDFPRPDPPIPVPNAKLSSPPYGYLLSWRDYHAPSALNQLLINNIQCRVAREPFQLENKDFPQGTIWIPSSLQSVDSQILYSLIDSLVEKYHVTFFPVYTGLTQKGPSLGSSRFYPLTNKTIAMVVGNGVSASSAGEIWHQLDQRYDIIITKIDAQFFSNKDLSSYNTILLPDGYYSSWSNREVESLQNWLQMEGNTLITLGNAALWTLKNQLSGPALKSKPSQKKTANPNARKYLDYFEERGTKSIGGIILSSIIDNTHPLFYGYESDTLMVFKRGSQFWEPHSGESVTPMVYSKNPLVSGYLPPDYKDTIGESAGVLIFTKGRGKVIHIADSPVFRAYWFQSNKILANALFFGSSIHSGTTAK